MAAIFSNVESITRNFKNNEAELNRIIQNTAAISDSIAASNLKSTVDNANAALASFSKVLEQINSGKGTMGLLLHDDKMYNHLESSAKHLDDLIVDIKTNPKRYVKVSVISIGGGDSQERKERRRLKREAKIKAKSE